MFSSHLFKEWYVDELGIKMLIIFELIVYCKNISISNLLNHIKVNVTSGSRGRTRRPPLTAANIWFFMPKTLNFLIFFPLAPLAIHFNPSFNRSMAKHVENYVWLQPSTISMIFYPPPLPRWQSPRPPPMVKSWIRHWTSTNYIKGVFQSCKDD